MPYFYKTTLAAICFSLCFSSGVFAKFKTERELEDAVTTGRMKEGQTHPNHTKIQLLQTDITERCRPFLDQRRSLLEEQAAIRERFGIEELHLKDRLKVLPSQRNEEGRAIQRAILMADSRYAQLHTEMQSILGSDQYQRALDDATRAHQELVEEKTAILESRKAADKGAVAAGGEPVGYKYELEDLVHAATTPHRFFVLPQFNIDQLRSGLREIESSREMQDRLSEASIQLSSKYSTLERAILEERDRLNERKTAALQANIAAIKATYDDESQVIAPLCDKQRRLKEEIRADLLTENDADLLRSQDDYLELLRQLRTLERLQQEQQRRASHSYNLRSKRIA